MIAEIASLTALAWATLSLHALTFLLDLISQILNEMSYFHRRTADHDPKSKVDFQREYRHRGLPFRLFLSGVVESII